MAPKNGSHLLASNSDRSRSSRASLLQFFWAFRNHLRSSANEYMVEEDPHLNIKLLYNIISFYF